MQGTILIVDDEPHIRDTIGLFLSAHGFSCSFAADVSGALEKLSATDFDIVLTDKNMPGASGGFEGGMELIRFIKDSHPDSAVIVMTGYASVETAVEAMKFGAYDYLSKPFTFESLLEKISRIRDYQHFLNAGDILSMHRAITVNVLEALESGSAGDEEQRTLLFGRLNREFDDLFHTFKGWERIIIEQRERLTTVGFLADELLDRLPQDDPARASVEAIRDQAAHRA